MSSSIIYGGRIGSQYLDRNLFETTFIVRSRQRLTATDVLDGLTNLIDSDDILELGRSEGAWSVTIKNKEAARILSEITTLTCGEKTASIVNVSRQIVDVRVHWMPAYIKDSFLGHIFEKFGIVREIRRESTVLSADTTKRNGVRVVTLETDTLNKGAIPHLLKFEGGITLLVTIAGRASLCLRCNQVGHVRRDCPRNYVEPTGTGPKSYAAAAAVPAATKTAAAGTAAAAPVAKKTAATVPATPVTPASSATAGTADSSGEPVTVTAPSEKRALEEEEEEEEDDASPEFQCGQPPLMIVEDMEEEHFTTVVSGGKKKKLHSFHL